MLRITRRSTTGGGTVLRLEGKLLAAWVPELLAEYSAARMLSPTPGLDLDQVSFVDADGLAALRGLVDDGAMLCTCSLFVRELLHVEPS